MQNVGIALKAANQTAVVVEGDANGTGSYYNSFTNINLQGGSGNSPNPLGCQNGWVMTYNGVYNRAPNADQWFGGRVGQFVTGMTLMGAGHSIFGTTFEGNTTLAVMNHPATVNGCTSIMFTGN